VIAIRPLRVKELSELFAVLPEAESTPGFDIGWRPEDPKEFILSACSTLVTVVDNNSTDDNDSSDESEFHLDDVNLNDLDDDSNGDSDNDRNDDSDDDRNDDRNDDSDNDRNDDHNDDSDNDCNDDRNDDRDSDNEKMVQFAHFSVKEYLISNRIANSAPVSHFHILPKPAHLVLARACLSVLLQLDYTLAKTKLQNFPLAEYAAEYWTKHARFEDVASDIRDGMDSLFDKNKPHLAAWNCIRDVERQRRQYKNHRSYSMHPDGVPLYHVASCGFRDLSVRLLDAHPQDLHAQGGFRGTPLHAAANKGHLDIVTLLLDCGADVESRGRHGQTALYMASSRGHVEVVRFLLDRGANLNKECGDVYGARWTPLHAALDTGALETASVLLEHGANVDGRTEEGWSPLHFAARQGYLEVVQLLLDRGADVNARMDDYYFTALHLAAANAHLQIMEALLKRGADPHVRTRGGETPFRMAMRGGYTEVMQLLSEHTGEKMEDPEMEVGRGDSKQVGLASETMD
jgi:ankyrin repeat protein